ncbi:MAG: glycoside hydrolase family 38 C-terminal domain-containing protein [Anaerocolumna sp.]
MKLKAHIVSHSHWDREWYMQYEHFHMKLVSLIDDVLFQIENNLEFHSFHLDGQMIIIDDYLKVRPENTEKLSKAIKNGKIKVGPWYVAQDCYLTSSEANVRNLQIGIAKAKEFEIKSFIGYFPDTFGFPLQTIQLYKQANINTLVFGRGVFISKDSSLNQSQSKYSELILQSPNGEQMLAILLSNWYNNGLEIPIDKDEAKNYWDKKILETKEHASTNHLLFMNGSDHQPLQKNITEAIRVANELYEDIEFVHTSLEDYIEELKEDLDYSKLTILKEEIKQQYTDGMFYLTGTASSRVPSKKLNFKVQNLIEKKLEPLQLISGIYDKGKNNYIWKLLLENHAHDSICGCSIDAVNNSVIERYNSISSAIYEELRRINLRIGSQIYSDKNSFSLTNCSTMDIEKYIEIYVNYDKVEFKDEDIDQVRSNAKSEDVTSYFLTMNGQKIESIIEDLGITNCYELPEYNFRKSMFCRKLKISFAVNIPAGTSKVYKINKCKISSINTKNDNIISNKYYEINISNGINLINKQTNESIDNFLEFVDCGDIGNTFMHGQIDKDIPIKLNLQNAKIQTFKTNNFEQTVVKTNFEIPISADIEDIRMERNTFVYLENRVTKRDSQLVNNPIEIIITLSKNSRVIDFKVKFENKSKDHRLRAIFCLPNSIKDVRAGTIFEQVSREPLINYEHKLSNNQNPFEKVLQIDTTDLTYSLMSKGLYEYEVQRNNKLELTLLRSVGEMGDWLYFDTPDAQVLGKHTLEFGISIINQEHKNIALSEGYNYYGSIHMIELDENFPVMSKEEHFEKIENNDVIVTGLKISKKNNGIIRGYALKDTNFNHNGKILRLLNILENKVEVESTNIPLKRNQIFTMEIEDFINRMN